uniref:Uncharacterized protein n=1 Tax=Arundo donax TaxID=35708 RepID=A0A0A8YML4_ARUDO
MSNDGFAGVLLSFGVNMQLFLSFSGLFRSRRAEARHFSYCLFLVQHFPIKVLMSFRFCPCFSM